MHFIEEFKSLSESRVFLADGEFESDTPVLSNPVCGDEVQVRVGLQGERLESLTYRCRGCWPVQGCLELLGRRLCGSPISEVLALSFEDFLGWVEGVPAGKRHAFSLTLRAVKSAVVENYHKENSISFGSPREEGYTRGR